MPLPPHRSLRALWRRLLGAPLVAQVLGTDGSPQLARLRGPGTAGTAPAGASGRLARSPPRTGLRALHRTGPASERRVLTRDCDPPIRAARPRSLPPLPEDRRSSQVASQKRGTKKRPRHRLGNSKPGNWRSLRPLASAPDSPRRSQARAAAPGEGTHRSRGLKPVPPSPQTTFDREGPQGRTEGSPRQRASLGPLPSRAGRHGAQEEDAGPDRVVDCFT